MGIDVRWEDEFGKQLEEVPDPEDCFGLALSVSDVEETVCLRFIDPYGDTMFNQWQIPVFLKELQALRAIITPERLASYYEQRNVAYQTANLSPKVLAEIKISQEKTSPSNVVKHIDNILELAYRSKGVPHTYLKLYGD